MDLVETRKVVPSSQESQLRIRHNKLGKLRVRKKEIKRELEELVVVEDNTEEDRETNKRQSNTLARVKKVFHILCPANICCCIKKSRRYNVYNRSELPKHPIAVEKENVVQINAGKLIPYFPAKELITGSLFIHFSPFCVMNG